MKYGLPYMGSKNKLAERIVELLPKKKHLVDLFCGGCAVSHAALVKRKYEHVHINDLNWMCPTLFMDVVAGRYKDEDRWISHDEFMSLRGTDPFVAIVWSFGNNMRDYMYSRKIEPYKKAFHYAVMYGDFSLMRDLCPDVCDACVAALEGVTDRHERRIRFGRAVAAWIDADGKRRNVELQNLESLESLQRLERLLTASTGDYAEVEIPGDSVIYCDIPYKDAKGYVGAMKFDYARFYDWCEMQTEPVFISSYKMQGGRVDCVAEFAHQSLIGKTTPVVERIFVPTNQKERGYTGRLNLFL